MNSKFNSTGYLGLLFVLVISFLYVWFALGYQFIIGKSPFWMSDSQDITQYIAGFNMYFKAAWQFPLLAFDNLNYPVGTRVTFVDAIPIYSLILKILLPSSLAPFNPFGVWVSICFICQGIAAWWISKELRLNSWLFLLALMAAFLTYPALLFRLGHISLMSHWILLFAIALYLRTYRLQTLPIVMWSIFLVISFHVNIYLFVMASGIYLAALLSIKVLKLRNFLLFVIPYLFLIVSLFILVLPLPPGGVIAHSGFGYFSMNLLSPFIGGRILDLQASVMPGQYEGFNYLGLGVIIAVFVALLLKRHSNSSFLFCHWALVSLLIGYTFFSLSNQIYFAQQLVMVVHYPTQLDSITTQFRATGRFFWPVGYCLIIFSFFTLYRYLSKYIFSLLIVLIVSIQLIDINKHFRDFRGKVNSVGSDKMNYASWDSAIEMDTKMLYFYPKYQCGGDPINTLVPVMKYAMLKGLKMNTGYIARYSPNCNNYDEEIASSFRAYSAYIFIKNVYPELTELNKYFPADAPPVCTEADFAYVCR